MLMNRQLLAAQEREWFSPTQVVTHLSMSFSSISLPSTMKEYEALVAGIKMALTIEAIKILIYSDS